MIWKLSPSLPGVFAFVGILYSCTTFGQEPSGGMDDRSEIEEIIVTARFREEYVQEIGASIAAYGEKQVVREGQVVARVAEGKSNKIIARELGISDGTVKVHVKNILRKLNLNSRLEIAVWAFEHGFSPGGQDN